MMTDSIVRASLRETLQKNQFLANSIVVEEFGVLHGLGRVDILVINQLLHGIEIKSERDTLSRLPNQIQNFSSVFDMVTLCVAFKHANKALRAVPDWWGVSLLAMNPDGGVDIYPARDAKKNPALDPLAIAKLLWKEEALQFLTSLGEANGLRSSNRKNIYDHIIQVASLEQIQSYVRSCLSRRKSNLADHTQKPNDDLY